MSHSSQRRSRAKYVPPTPTLCVKRSDDGINTFSGNWYEEEHTSFIRTLGIQREPGNATRYISIYSQPATPRVATYPSVRLSSRRSSRSGRYPRVAHSGGNGRGDRPNIAFFGGNHGLQTRMYQCQGTNAFINLIAVDSMRITWIQQKYANWYYRVKYQLIGIVVWKR